jgi:hypothetical protein
MQPSVSVVQSSGHRGLLAHRIAHHGIESPIARRRFVGHGLTLVAPPGRLVVGLERPPFLDDALQSVS